MTDTVKPEAVPEDVRKLARDAADKFVPYPGKRTILTDIIEAAILADRAARPDTGLLREAAEALAAADNLIEKMKATMRGEYVAGLMVAGAAWNDARATLKLLESSQ